MLAREAVHSRAWGYALATTLAWAPMYTVLVLGFRWVYLGRVQSAGADGPVIALAVLYSVAGGLALPSAVLALVLPSFIHVFVAIVADAGRVLDEGLFAWQQILKLAPQNALLILVWCFVYVGATAARRGRNAELDNLRLQAGISDARLAALDHQLNPHFLFASLGTIGSMIHQDEDQADVMITNFSEVLRHSLESGGRDRVGLEEEVAAIRQYVELVQCGSGPAFDLQVQVDAPCRGALVPSSVLTTLIDRALAHGSAAGTEGATVSLAASCRQTQLEVRVVSNAVRPGAAYTGMDAVLLAFARRLDLLYGSRASLLLEPSGERFSAMLALPLEAVK